jgi:hypothetical protein
MVYALFAQFTFSPTLACKARIVAPMHAGQVIRNMCVCVAWFNDQPNFFDGVVFHVNSTSAVQQTVRCWVESTLRPVVLSREHDLIA